jgi:methyl-accepting chemotaxis protein
MLNLTERKEGIMKIKQRLSLVITVIMALVETFIVSILLHRTSWINLDLNMRNVEYLASQQAEFWKGKGDAYIRALRTLADVMSYYDTLPKQERRDRYDKMLKSVLESSEPDMVSLYMVWKSNAIDGMDERYIGRVGSNPSGQYAIAYIRETGRIKARTSDDIENIMAHISGPNARRDRVDNPKPQKVNGKDTFTFRMSVPIIKAGANEVVGSVGCVLDIGIIQRVVDNMVKINDIIDMAVVYSGNGTILAHVIPERIGKKIFDVDVELGDSIPLIFMAVQNGTAFRDTKYIPALHENIGFVIKPFQIGNSDQKLAILIGAGESKIFKEVRNIATHIIILAVLTLALSAVIVYFVLNNITKPIIKKTKTVKVIPLKEQDRDGKKSGTISKTA